MKINFTVVGITDFHDIYEEHAMLPILKREIRFVENPPSLNIYYPILEPIKTGYMMNTDFINGTRYTSHLLKNLIIYED